MNYIRQNVFGCPENNYKTKNGMDNNMQSIVITAIISSYNQ